MSFDENSSSNKPSKSESRSSSSKAAALTKELSISTDRETRRRSLPVAVQKSMIAADYADKLPKTKPTFGNIRKGELRKVFEVRYGGDDWTFPDDDAGEDDCQMYITTCVIASNGQVLRFLREIFARAPWISKERLEKMIENASSEYELNSLDSEEAAARLSLTYAQRQEFDIRTIGACDVSKAERKEIQRHKHRERERVRRSIQKAKRSPKLIAAQIKPWLKEGISRATYYRRQKSLKELGEKEVEK